MKQIFYFLAFTAIAFVVSHQASAQNNQRWNYTYSRGNGDYRDACMQSFYYYPQSNVYFNVTTHQYVYPYRGSWVVSDRLPHQWRLRNEPRFVVNHYGSDVWNENRFHMARFRNYRYNQPDVAYAPPGDRHDYGDRYDNNNRHDDRRDDDYRDDNRRKY